MEEVCTACPSSWFQAYLPGNRERYLALIDRIAAAGFKTLVVTVDVAILSNRENNVRAGFAIPMRPTPRLFWDGLTRPRWTFGTFLPTILRHGIPHLENNFAERGAPVIARNVERDLGSRDNLDWKDWDVVRERWKGRLIIKGVMRADDARIAIDRGAEGVIVSNHGGRQLDHTVSPLRVLTSIKEAAGNVPVMLDSGIRRGTDVLKGAGAGRRLRLRRPPVQLRRVHRRRGGREARLRHPAGRSAARPGPGRAHAARRHGSRLPHAHRGHPQPGHAGLARHLRFK
jgi:L-lactate dehydrogenase (cytochrome)